jgi:hypothetical protein
LSEDIPIVSNGPALDAYGITRHWYGSWLCVSHFATHQTPMGFVRDHLIIDLLSNRVQCEAGIALVVAVYSAIKRHSVQPGLLVLGNLRIQGNMKSEGRAAVCAEERTWTAMKEDDQ